MGIEAFQKLKIIKIKFVKLIIVFNDIISFLKSTQFIETRINFIIYLKNIFKINSFTPEIYSSKSKSYC